MFLAIIKKLLDILWIVFRIPLYVLLIFLIILGISVLIHIIDFHFFKKLRLPVSSSRRYPAHGFFRKLFYDFPKAFVTDLYNREPDFFRYQGLIVFTGRQGRGKSIAMTEFARRMHYEYPKSKSISNLSYPWDNEILDDWHKLIDYSNGHSGVIAVIDELQLWFSQRQSANFPPEMLGVITQNRKNRRIILGTAQSVHNLAKDIRVQATEIRECNTFFGCLTVVRRREPVVDCDGNIIDYKERGFYFFVHDKALRESYDTWKVVTSTTANGFQPRLNLQDFHIS